MASLAQIVRPFGDNPQRLAARLWVLLGAAAVIALAGAFLVGGPLRLAAFSGALTLLLVAALVRGGIWLNGRRMRQVTDLVREIVAEDAAPCFTTDRDGAVRYRNAAAEARFGRDDGRTLVATLGDIFAHPAAVLYRLQSRAANMGAAREDVVTRRGHVRLSVHRAGEDGFLWRLEEMTDRPGQSRGADSISLPMVVASKTGTVLYVNEALRRVVGGRPRTLDRIFPHLPLRPGEETIVSGADGPVRALVAEIDGAAERREIFLMPSPGGGTCASPASAAHFDLLPVALLRLSAAGRILEANRAACDILGLDPASQPLLSELLEGPGRSLRDWISDMLAGRTASTSEVLAVRRSGPESFVQVALRPEEGGTVVAVLTDATALKTLEAQFVQSQKMQAIGQLAGGVAHDFNNLLTAISGHCDLLLLRRSETDPDFADLIQIHQNANRAAALVGQLLAFSRKQTLTPERIHLAEVLSEVTHLLRRLLGERVALALDPVPEIGPIRVDRRQFEQVLMNLAVNARDAMPEGGTIRVETERRRLAEPLQRDRATVPAGDYAVLRVIDEGIGMTPEIREKVFEPFFTTKGIGEGTGLGLSTVYGIVKQSGGFIFVDSVEGVGTTFSLYFPIASDEPAATTEVQPAPAAEGRGENAVILLVEDEAPVRAFAARALRLRGHTVVEAENAEQALAALADPTVSVDVVVTDVVMPGMDGPTWVREALKGRPGVRIVFVSGYAEDSIAEIRGDIPNSVFLPKPFSLEDLTSTVQRQLH